MRILKEQKLAYIHQFTYFRALLAQKHFTLIQVLQNYLGVVHLDCCFFVIPKIIVVQHRIVLSVSHFSELN